MSYVPVRKNTNRMLELVEEGMLDKDQVILACLSYMTDSEVKQMAELNEFFLDEEEEAEEADEEADED